MPPLTLTLTAADPAATSLAVLDGTGTTPWALVREQNWGNAIWEPEFSGPRGTLGARPTSAKAKNRDVTLNLRLSPTSVDDGAAQLRQLVDVVDAMRRNGGRITVRHTDQTWRQHLEVFAGSAGIGGWTADAENRGLVEVSVNFTCGPYVLGDSMRVVVDPFTAAGVADWTFDLGTSASYQLTEGALGPVAAGTELAMVHTGVGYMYGDHQATLRAIPQTRTNHKAGVILKRTTATDRLEAYIDDDGTNTRLRIDKIVSGTRTNLATTNLGSRPAAGAMYHVAGRVEGNTVHAEYWGPGSPPWLAQAATTAISYTLTGTELTAFGEGQTGQGGMVVKAASTSDRWEAFDLRPFVYRGANHVRTVPEDYRLDGAIPGDARAIASVDVGATGIASDLIRFAMIGWGPRALTYNMAVDGGFEYGAGIADARWSVAAITGVNGAATSLTVNSTGGRFGAYYAAVAMPATANTGAALQLWPKHRFRPGVLYTAEAWVRVDSGSGSCRLKLGVNGSMSTGGTITAPAGWTKITATWTPTTASDMAYVVVERTDAAATLTLGVDGVRVFEGPTLPTAPAHQRGGGGHPPFGILSPGAAAQLSGFTFNAAAGANYRLGTSLDASGSTGASAMWVVDPDLIPRDDLSGSLEVEVWVHGLSWPAGSVWTAWSQPADWTQANQSFTREYGSAGKTIATNTNSGLIRLGTISLAPYYTPGGGAAEPVPAVVGIGIATGVSLTSLRISHVLLVLARSRLVAPTGKANTGYPAFSFISSANTQRRYLADGRGLDVRRGGQLRMGPGLGGGSIELDPGDVDLHVTLARHVPDGTAGGAVTSLLNAASVAVTPTPRWHYLRDA